MSSSAARGFLKAALKSTHRGGQNEGKAIVLTGLGDGEYEMRVMLRSEGLVAATEMDETGPTLLGSVEHALLDTFEFMVRRKSVIAREIRDAFELKTVAAATNRLIRLADLGLVRRVGQEPAEGGGLQYRYAAVQ